MIQRNILISKAKLSQQQLKTKKYSLIPFIGKAKQII